jgi:hypothetical protein
MAMTPFWSSGVGGSQVTLTAVELMGVAWRLLGGPVGAIETKTSKILAALQPLHTDYKSTYI